MRVPEDLPPTVLWAQTSKDLRGRLGELHSDPPPRIARYLERGHLWFRAASVPDDAKRRAALAAVLSGRLELGPPLA